MIKKWDLAIRLYHWVQAILVVLLLTSGFSGKGSTLIHIGAGLILMTLLFWRIAWGVIGSETARFSHFLAGPQAIIKYLSSGKSKHVGHNPAGAIMVIMMLILLMFQTASGLITTDFIDGVFLVGIDKLNTLENLHKLNAILLLVLIFIHILAIIIYRSKGIFLVKAMISGYSSSDQKQPFLKGNLRAGLTLLLSPLVTISLITTLYFLSY